MKKIVRNMSAPARDVSAFLQRASQMQAMVTHGQKPGRLAFIIDATASRQPAWDNACRIQGRMFEAVDGIGHLQIQLVYFRGFDDFQATAWLNDSKTLLHEMKGVSCLAGHTRIERAFRHLLTETTRQPVAAAVYIGDACEEPAAVLLQLAGQLGLRKTPLFMFQENNDPHAAGIYEAVAKLSGGAYCRFDSTSADILIQLLSAAAVYAAGGKSAMAAFTRDSTPQLQDLTRQLLS
jgi:hypothetical protein